MSARIITLALAASLVAGASARAAFYVRLDPTFTSGLPANEESYELYAKGDAAIGGSASRVIRYRVDFRSISGSAKFAVYDTDDGFGNGEDGTPDTVDLYNGQDRLRSSIRLSSTRIDGGESNVPSALNINYTSVTPSAAFAQPNPWINSRSFRVDVEYVPVLGVTNAPLAVAGRGVRLARLIVERGTAFDVTGYVIGNDLSVSEYFTFAGYAIDIPPVFGNGILEGSPDPRLTLQTTGDNPTIYTLTVDTSQSSDVPISFRVNTKLSVGTPIVSGRAEGISIATEPLFSPGRVFGTIQSGLQGTFDFNLYAQGFGTDTAILRIVAIPEPTSLVLVACSGFLLARVPRRRPA